MEFDGNEKEYVVVRVLHYENYFTNLFSDMSKVSIPNGQFDEPNPGDRVTLLHTKGSPDIIRIGSQMGEIQKIS